jgi:hypothetical protein
VEIDREGSPLADGDRFQGHGLDLIGSASVDEAVAGLPGGAGSK